MGTSEADVWRAAVARDPLPLCQNCATTVGNRYVLLSAGLDPMTSRVRRIGVISNAPIGLFPFAVFPATLGNLLSAPQRP